MTFFRDLLWKIQGILLIVWYLFVALLFIILLPFLLINEILYEITPKLSKKYETLLNKIFEY